MTKGPSTMVLVLLVQLLNLTMIRTLMHTTQWNLKSQRDHRKTILARKLNNPDHPHTGAAALLVEEAGAEEDGIALIQIGFPAEVQGLFLNLAPLE